MIRILVPLACGGLGLWLGSRQGVPGWVAVVLLVLGTGLWLIGHRLERRERQS